MDIQRATLTVVTVLVVTGLAIAPLAGGVAPAVETASADVGSDATLPAQYHGTVQVDLDEQTAPGQELEVTAYAIDGDGERTEAETLIADEDGVFGGPSGSDEKITVQETDQVEFEVGGVIATVLEVDGESVNSERIDWSGGTQELLLEVDADALDGEPDFQVNITDAPESVSAGDPVDLTARSTTPAMPPQRRISI